MSRMKSLTSLDAKIEKTRQQLRNAQARYDRLSDELLALTKERETLQGLHIAQALKRSGKSYQELMNFLSV